jgi:hypothetical protein
VIDNQLLTTTTTPEQAYQPPIGVTPAWQAVMDRAGHQCQCVGACGNRHSKSGLRCGTESGYYVKGSARPVILSAGPADAALPAEQAARLPVDQLQAWCPTCWTAAGRRSRARLRHFEQHDNEPDTLF